MDYLNKTNKILIEFAYFVPIGNVNSRGIKWRFNMSLYFKKHRNKDTKKQTKKRTKKQRNTKG